MTTAQALESVLNAWVNGRKVRDGIPLTIRQQAEQALLTADAQATVEALREQLRLANIDQANAEARANDLQQQVEALQREREKVKAIEKVLDIDSGKTTVEKVVDLKRSFAQVWESYQDAANEMFEAQAQLSQLQALVRAKEDAYEKILLSRERLEREMRGYPPVDNEGIPMVWQEPVGWVKRHPGRHDASAERRRR